MSRSKSWIRIACAGFLVAIPVLCLLVVGAVILFWGLGINRMGNQLMGANFIVLAANPPVAERQLYGLLATLVPLSFWLWSMWRLFGMFRRFNKGPLLGAQTIYDLRAFALFSTLTVVTGFLLSGVMRWAAGFFDDAPLWTHLGFTPTHAAILFMAAIIFVATHIIEEGYRFQREIEEYV